MTTLEEKTKIDITLNNSFNPVLHEYEVVERKGLGHPDTICDAIAEKASRYYSLTCLKKFGRVAHHWFDKVLLIGGESLINFGKGKLSKPYEVIFAGKAALTILGQEIDLYSIQKQACIEVLTSLLHGFIPSEHLIIQSKITDYQGPGRKNSRYRPQLIDDLVDLEDKQLFSNDCNVCTGYAPLTLLEKIVLGIENKLLEKKFKYGESEIGVDIKIVGTRKGSKYHLLVNIPLIADYVSSFEYYTNKKKQLLQKIKEYINLNFSVDAEVEVNPADEGQYVYLTATGTVADTGDVGVTGRGNRLNGLITPMRPMSIEASSGKNPIDHTGKIYGVLSQKIADRIFEITNIPNSVLLSTSKGKLVDKPNEIIISLSTDQKEIPYGIIEKVVHEELGSSNKLSAQFIKEGITLW